MYMFICICICICKYIYIYIYVYVYVYVNVYVYMYIYICKYVNMYICIYVYMYMYVCVYVYVYIYIFEYTWYHAYMAKSQSARVPLKSNPATGLPESWTVRSDWSPKETTRSKRIQMCHGQKGDEPVFILKWLGDGHQSIHSFFFKPSILTMARLISDFVAV